MRLDPAVIAVRSNLSYPVVGQAEAREHATLGVWKVQLLSHDILLDIRSIWCLRLRVRWRLSE